MPVFNCVVEELRLYNFEEIACLIIAFTLRHTPAAMLS